MFRDELKEWPERWPSVDSLFVFSSTFGLNDPFTLAWLADLDSQSGACQDDGEAAASLKKLGHRFRPAVEKVFGSLFKTFPSRPLCTTTDGASLDHAFPWLRWARLLTSSGQEQRPKQVRWRTALLRHLESILHRHLSYAAIPDSEYDPPEMVLALEGMLVLDADFDRAVIERVLRILAEPEMSRLFWRAHRPMIAHSQGTVLPPISTEIGNSILRICGMVDPTFGSDLFAICEPPLRRYSDWLLSRKVQGSAKRPNGKEAEFSGWHSDHVLAADTVHLWMTAHTALFLHDYTAFLRRQIRRLSGFSETRKTECQAEAKNKDRDCKKELADREPLLGIDKANLYRVTDHLVDEFIEPWRAREPKNFSMLLYGPPGTGKSTFAKLLAGALNWELVQLSPSDFVRGGESAVEERAKAVFNTLEQMSTVVVLFDEIDRLVLDRDAKAYISQSDVFQFMTPSMLTKINDLGAKKRLIFIIATNFAERIDGAIKRPGRIDRQYLWLPPDAKRRREILAGLLTRRAKALLRESNPNLTADELDTLTERIAVNAKRETGISTDLIRGTTFWIYKELESLFDPFTRAEFSPGALKASSDTDTATESFKQINKTLLGRTKSVTATIRLINYRGRLRDTSDDPAEFPYADEPYEEFLLLLHDAFQSKYELAEGERGMLEKLDLLTKLDRVRDAEIRDALRQELKRNVKSEV
jgi:DNA polymerase III delta prime subunit